ncbi:myosin light chain kinase 3 isoform X2 [Clupea harengus]|uniref:Myosin light chain kinase 3 isoform X2 n=1 Tax=Clupea harengus TaxID=7950 RepID=A0A8M1KD00_CLUHA|nr:myosin light chain kinase 3 isoform X2 [Clupea harengus]
MGTTSFCRSLLLSTGGFSVSDYIRKFTKTKSEDGSVKHKPDLCDQGTQVQEDIQDSVPDKHQQGEKSQVQSLNVPAKSPESEVVLPEVKGQDAECKVGAQPSSEAEESSKAQRRQKEVTLKSREPTRVQTFAPEVQQVLAITEAPIEAVVVLIEDETVATVLAIMTPQALSVGEEASAKEGIDVAVDGSDIPPQPSQEEKPLRFDEEELTTQSKLQEAVPREEPKPPPEASGAKADKPSTEADEAGSAPTVPEPQLDQVQTKPVDKVQDKPTLATVSETVEDCTKATPPQPPVTEKNSLLSLLGKDSDSQLLVIDDCPPQAAPFLHRIVSAKQVPMGSYYSVKPNEILGGGRFGQVHKCAELSSGLTLAAKIIKVRGMKERDEVKNEIGVMNQLNHVNLIQLYDAFESRTNLTLIMEYVEGGELFNRIVDDNYLLTELDAIVFTRQICEGVQYLHQQYILHLDLKPENILCVTNTGNQIKIIDFGLARKYRPREKLKVNFGTPEFLAPEVVNYDFVSFPTDMWSVGVITYMLLSGLSPFLGDNDAETMNNILHANWDFDSEAFENVSEEAKDFVSRLLVPAKCGRISASGCLKHSWLNDLEEKAKIRCVRLKSQLHLQRYLAAHRQWKKHFYVVAAANRFKKFNMNRTTNPA